MALAAGAVSDSVHVEYYRVATQRDPSDGGARYLLATYLDKLGERGEAVEGFCWVAQNASSPGLSDSWVGAAHYQLGRFFEDEGQLDEAVQQYEIGLGLNGRLVDGLSRLERLYRLNGEAARAEEVGERLAALEPEYVVGQEVGKGWVLLGYDLDEDALAAGGAVEVALYWLGQGQIAEGTQGWYDAGQRYIQLAEVLNLVPNGGFEHDEIRGQKIPETWQIATGTPGEGEHFLVLEHRDGLTSTSLALRSTTQGSSTSLCTRDIEVGADRVYLGAGSFDDDGGAHGQLVCTWLIDRKREHTYISRGTGDTTWVTASAILVPPQDASSCRICVLNAGSQGETRFDNIVLFELDMPKLAQ
jgi:hypothetical protein